MDEITRTPNPFGNCEDCGHPYGEYAELFGYQNTPQDINECLCGCHEVEAEDVPHVATGQAR